MVMISRALRFGRANNLNPHEFSGEIQEE